MKFVDEKGGFEITKKILVLGFGVRKPCFRFIKAVRSYRSPRIKHLLAFLVLGILVIGSFFRS